MGLAAEVALAALFLVVVRSIARFWQRRPLRRALVSGQRSQCVGAAPLWCYWCGGP